MKYNSRISAEITVWKKEWRNLFFVLYHAQYGMTNVSEVTEGVKKA